MLPLASRLPGAKQPEGDLQAPDGVADTSDTRQKHVQHGREWHCVLWQKSHSVLGCERGQDAFEWLCGLYK